MSTFVKEYEQLFNRLMNLQTKKASVPACQTRNLAFCPVTFETSDEWGSFSKVTISRFILKDFGEWEMMIAGEYMEGKDIDSLREVLQEKLPLVDLSMIHYNYDWILQ